MILNRGKTLCVTPPLTQVELSILLTATLVSVADGKPGQVGKVRITVIDGDARVDPHNELCFGFIRYYSGTERTARK